MKGKLDIIIGCMFSGKTTELQNRIHKHKLFNNDYIVINHSFDDRYSSTDIATHDKKYLNSLSVTDLKEFKNTDDYKKNSTIFIGEAQFFSNLKEFVTYAVDNDGKEVVICGLDGDYKRNIFGEILELIPHADTIQKKSALCIFCRDGTPGIFSKRIIDPKYENVFTNDQILIGSGSTYCAVCREHYLKHCDYYMI